VYITGPLFFKQKRQCFTASDGVSNGLYGWVSDYTKKTCYTAGLNGYDHI